MTDKPLKPIIMCPYCEWNLNYGDKKVMTKYKEHLEDCEDYKECLKDYNNMVE